MWKAGPGAGLTLDKALKVKHIEPVKLLFIKIKRVKCGKLGLHG